MNTFDILMVIGLGTLFGTIAGLAIGYAARLQGPWQIMTPRQKTMNAALVLGFSVVFIAGLAAYELFFS